MKNTPGMSAIWVKKTLPQAIIKSPKHQKIAQSGRTAHLVVWGEEEQDRETSQTITWMNISMQHACNYSINLNSLSLYSLFYTLPMTGFEPRASGVGSDRATNWTTIIYFALYTNNRLPLFANDLFLPKSSWPSFRLFLFALRPFPCIRV